MDITKEHDFWYWKGGAYKEPLYLLFYKIPLIGILDFMLFVFGIAIQSWETVLVCGLVFFVYIIIGGMMAAKTRGAVNVEEGVLYFRLGSKEILIPWEDVLEVTYYFGRTMDSPPAGSNGRGHPATFCRCYNLLIRTKEKYYNLYNSYESIPIGDKDDKKLSNVELHQIYLLIYDAWKNYHKQKAGQEKVEELP